MCVSEVWVTEEIQALYTLLWSLERASPGAFFMAVTSGYHSRVSVKRTGGAGLGQRLASGLLEVCAQAFQCYLLLLKKPLMCVFLSFSSSVNMRSYFIQKTM